MIHDVLQTEQRICRLRGWDNLLYLREAIVPARSYTSPWAHDEYCEVVAFSVIHNQQERPHYKRVWFLRYEDGAYIDGYSWPPKAGDDLLVDPSTITKRRQSGPVVKRVLTRQQMNEGAEYRDRCLAWWNAHRTVNGLPARERPKPKSFWEKVWRI